MFLGNYNKRNPFDDKFDRVVSELSDILSHVGITVSGPAFPNWIGDGSVLWKKPAFGKAFKSEVLKATKEAEVYYHTTYPDATEADLQSLPRMVALKVATEAWISAHPDRFPDANIKG